ncbi:hypothetical protein GO755_25570 [Spirosoma sp. HMF4905]|uniref:Uncharacterized protein n=1 Tax=Spirosoma arboris TaxID=2682092 RepID=A0A7K1SI05_9BACT|nr:hypothetical protein [Spirosoma arboris]MVM33432.1 hypothetical protein [Spirosoma arboris]
MRNVIAKDVFKLPDFISEADYKSIALIKYREILLEHGQAAADASPLFAQKW